MKKYLYIILAFIFVSCTANQRQQQQAILVDSEKTSTSVESKQKVIEESETIKEIVDNSFEGIYYCSRSGDQYTFNKGGSGNLLVKGGLSPSTFKWSRSGANVVITFTGQSSAFGKQKLTYNEKKKTVTEESKSFGILVFTKNN